MAMQHNCKTTFLCVSITAVMSFVSCGEKQSRPQNGQTSKIPDHLIAVANAELKIPELPKYNKPLNVVLSATVSADQKLLTVTFSGEGECALMAAAAFSDKGKRLLYYEVEESVLKADLATMGGTIEWCIIIPNLFSRKYETTISYPIPDEFSGKFSDVAASCLIYPQDNSDQSLYDPILVESDNFSRD
jgi:hypothetical protein